MTIQILPLSHPLDIISDKLPLDSPTISLPGGEVIYSSGEYGILCVQEYLQPEFLIRYWAADMLEDFEVRVNNFFDGFHCLLALRNRFSLTDSKGQHDTLNENAAAIFPSTSDYKLNFQAPFSYRYIEAGISLQLMEDLLNSIDVPGPSGLGMSKKIIVNEELRENVKYILHCQMKPSHRRLYFADKVKDIFFHLLVLSAKTLNQHQDYGEHEYELATKTAEIIRSDLSTNRSIIDLAKLLQTNDTSLKRAFKKIHGLGIHEFLIRERLQLAFQLLHQGISVKETAIRTGWRPSDLIKVYFKKYGKTPGSVRKS